MSLSIDGDITRIRVCEAGAQGPAPGFFVALVAGVINMRMGSVKGSNPGLGLFESPLMILELDVDRCVSSEVSRVRIEQRVCLRVHNKTIFRFFSLQEGWKNMGNKKKVLWEQFRLDWTGFENRPRNRSEEFAV